MQSLFSRSQFSCPSAELCDDEGLAFPLPVDSERPRLKALLPEFCKRPESLSGVRLMVNRLLFVPVAGNSSVLPMRHSCEETGVNIALLRGEVAPKCVGDMDDTGGAAMLPLQP